MKAIVSRVPTAARLFLGLLFTVFGLNGFFGFLPMPPPTAAGGAFLGALAATGYMFPLIKGTEVVVGLLFLSGRFVPLALTLLAPVSVNILAYHLLLDPAPGLPLVIVATQLFLAYAYRESFRSVLRAKAEPTAVAESDGQHLGRLRSQGV
jgi:uncharacterized membrane protein YphA (DoxX/SURF4 family)